MGRTLVLSHRGRTAGPPRHGPPDNTLEAFQAAAAVGVDGFETDVRMTRDGALVLFHDETVAVGFAVADLTHAELMRALRFEVPTLADALDAHPERMWDVELKSRDTAAAAAEVLRESRARAGLWVSSFRHDLATAVGRAADVPFAWLVGEPPGDPAPLIAAARGEGAAGLVWRADHLRPAAVDLARDADLDTWVYGMKSRGAHRAILAMGPRGVITDYPSRVDDSV